ncbi:two-component system response regulator [Desulfobacter hydrogenophilus]|uniref:Two-component system response regulator n=1 Tax=Desulfobacter hydrogenophilus TaxID=2291 RepID=A0A328FBQ3_9BACT|nr:two-component system response regulator [Desulfobacter hydrogenophilus]NDY73675.1 two-component system response regulator [Desulfobacter hydrogenophilus]QBH11766.1 two-component system response regulator [Desulfobacter hydrogenophilus]RAM00543.1 two-component system response regulator [Desulfobacter hydrogenophilus]
MEDQDRKRTILIVEDSPENIDVLVGILQKNYRLKIATSGEKALRIVAQGASPNLILLDIQMPGIDGYEVCRLLKKDPVTRQIPVIFVTAFSSVKEEEKGFALGCVDYIIKPVSPPIVLQRVKTHMALYDQNRKLEDKVAKRTQQLENAFSRIKESSLETIHILSKAAEYRDEDTGSHIYRISNYSAAIARKIGLSEKIVESILYAAPMHDVGKIGIPDSILLKPGGLTVDEFTTMKQHTLIGAKILENSKTGFIRLGEAIALTHHEWWNGTGYPRGLKEREIPLEGRIIAVADVFDALTTKRPYKEPFPLDVSFRIIAENRGTQFDPEVVDAFFFIKSEILKIRKKYADD